MSPYLNEKSTFDLPLLDMTVFVFITIDFEVPHFTKSSKNVHIVPGENRGYPQCFLAHIRKELGIIV